MTARYLLDTNICIYIRRNRSQQLISRFESLMAGEAAISVITWGELLYGAEKSLQREEALSRLHDFIAIVPVLPMSASTSQAYGQIRASLEKRGEPIGNNDLWIAAHAQAHELTLVTNNEREFRRIGTLKIENWSV